MSADRVQLIHGDCLVEMRKLIDQGIKVDSVVCDPPYELGFMGKSWDSTGIAYNPAVWALCLELLKPGGYIVAFSSSRTFGRMSVAIEDAGFIVLPMLGWIFATGFPKATRLKAPGTDGLRYGGQALKPALEPIFMGQKPMEGTGTENWLKYGTGAVNIDACRVDSLGEPIPISKSTGGRKFEQSHTQVARTSKKVGEHMLGRWPANLVTDGSDEVIAALPDSGGQAAPVTGRETSRSTTVVYGKYERSGVGLIPRNDSGSAARFFFSAKAGADDRCDSRHPTIKPVALIRWLQRFVTPPGGTVLDCFAGSGTSGVAAIREGFRAILIERETEYVSDIRRRLDRLDGSDAPLFAAMAEDRAEDDLFFGSAG